MTARLLAAALLVLIATEPASAADPVDDAFGDRLEVVEPYRHDLRTYRLTPEEQKQATVTLRGPWPNVVRVVDADADSPRTPLDFEFVSGTRDVRVHLGKPGTKALEFLVANDSGLTASGAAFVLRASEAEVVTDGGGDGEPTAKLLRQPGNDRVGFWTSDGDRLRFDRSAFEAFTPRLRVAVDLVYSRDGETPGRLDVAVDDSRTESVDLPATGGWGRFRTLRLLEGITLGDLGDLELAWGESSDGKPALMDFKAVVLTPSGDWKVNVLRRVDPPRVKIDRNEHGLRVVGGDGQLLRGTSVMVFKFDRDRGASDYLHDGLYWDRLEEYGFNAIRLCYFEPYQKAHGFANDPKPFPYADIHDPDDRAELFAELDYLVDTAAARGMVVLLNSHNTGGYRDPDHSGPTDAGGEFAYLDTMKDLEVFWREAARRYAKRTHVFFEPMNEYVKWRPGQWTDRDIEDTKVIYDLIREEAPETHISLLTFANDWPKAEEGREPQTMHSLASRLKDLGVDFSNASIAFHPYNPGLDPHPSSEILKLMADFPVVNTEQNFPATVVPEVPVLDARGLDGDRLGIESMERLGISWFHWNIARPRQLTDYVPRILIEDAKAKDYWWGEE